jgi:dihydrofolate synthase / folylpolyglutamate synthase
MNYNECLAYLAELGQELHGRKFSLETISGILSELGSPQDRYGTAIVAGTNGKGSTCAMLASILQQAGHATGLFTSPHLVRVNERIRVNGRDISDEDFAGAFSEIAGLIERLISTNKLAKPPSFFEFLAATAFLHFARVKTSFVVLEVGMGGRLDATNVVDPRLAVITNIDFDHMEFLGSTLAAIAREKAGIIKPRRPVISGVEDGEATDVIRHRAEEIGADLMELKTLVETSRLRSEQGRYAFDMAIGQDRFAGLTCPLMGKFQVKNTTAAVAAAWRLRADGLEISRRCIPLGLGATAWPGRLEAILHRPLVILDGGHNPGAARELAAFLKEEYPDRRVRVVYASMHDKAIREICQGVFPLAEEIYLTRPDHPRAATPEQILAALDFRPAKVQINDQPALALEQACAASSPDDVVLVFGSLFLVGAIKQAQRDGKLHL